MNELNLQLFHWINLSPQAPDLLLGLARVASTVLPSALLVAVLSLLLVPDRALRRAVLLTLLAMLLAALVSRGLSQAWPAPRPFALGLGHQWLAHKPTPSFPSSHASVAFALGFALWRLIPHRAGRWVPLGLALMVGWSRLALGLHFPLDVLAGVAVGALSWALVHALWASAAHGRGTVPLRAPLRRP
jgi:undecaprenyl-diphosphatase